MTNLAIALFVMLTLFYLSFYDISERRIPNQIVIPSTVILISILTILGKFLGRGPDLSRAYFGFGFSLCFFLALFAISPNGIGMGDVKLSAFLGSALAWNSYNALFIGLVAMFLISGLYSLVLVIKRPSMIRASIPFAPFMTLGYLVGLVMR
jgi:leader peptidase (prepilin peptidase)/N-methyltransferase